MNVIRLSALIKICFYSCSQFRKRLSLVFHFQARIVECFPLQNNISIFAILSSLELSNIILTVPTDCGVLHAIVIYAQPTGIGLSL